MHVAMHPVPTSADVGPDLCTLHLVRTFLLSTGATIPLAQAVVVTSCKHTCDGGISLAATNADNPLAHMVVHPLKLMLVLLFHLKNKHIL